MTRFDRALASCVSARKPAAVSELAVLVFPSACLAADLFLFFVPRSHVCSLPRGSLSAFPSEKLSAVVPLDGGFSAIVSVYLQEGWDLYSVFCVSARFFLFIVLSLSAVFLIHHHLPIH